MDFETTSIPLNERILRYDGDGVLTVVDDNRLAIQFLLERKHGALTGCGMAAPSCSGAPRLAGLGLLGLVALRWRCR